MTSKHYLLSPIDHKSVINGLIIAKEYENNLRERNPQLGIVVCDKGGLKKGDIVAVHHFSFCSEIGKDKSFLWQEHVEHDGKKVFKVPADKIYFKYNNKTPEVLPGFCICKDVEELKSLNMDANTGVFSWSKRFDKSGYCTHGKYAGKHVIVKNFAFYLITLDGIDYFKVREDEVVLADGEPTEGNHLVEYIEHKHELFDLSAMRANNVRARDVKTGEEMQVWRNNGVEWNGKWVIDNEMIIWMYETA